MLPTDSLVRFIVCETARQEKDNKVTLLGVFPDDKVLLPVNAQLPAAFSLALVYFFLDGVGPFNGSFEIKSPVTNWPPYQAQMPTVDKAADQPGTLMLSFMPFVAPAFGRYEVKLILNGQDYLRGFEVAAAAD